MFQWQRVDAIAGAWLTSPAGLRRMRLGAGLETWRLLRTTHTSTIGGLQVVVFIGYGKEEWHRESQPAWDTRLRQGLLPRADPRLLV